MALNLFIDMDGTLAVNNCKSLSDMYVPGYFRGLKPLENVVNGIMILKDSHPEINLSVLTCVMQDRPGCESEKLEWLSEYCPFLNVSDIMFLPCGESKREAAGKGQNYLLDDYSANLLDFDDGSANHGIKLLNGYNGAGIRWHGDTMDSEMDPREFAELLYDKMLRPGSAS